MERYSISFVLPMYNEAENITDTLQKLTRMALDICRDYEIIVIDDASQDNGCRIVDDFISRDDHIKLVRLPKNTKFGGALHTGLKKASRPIIIYTDADLPVKEKKIKKGLESLAGADIVTGYSLALKDSSFKRIIISRVYNFLVKFLFGLQIKDINSGFKIYRAEALHDMKLYSRSPFIDTEIFVEALKKNYRIKQFGLIFDLRTKGKSTVARPTIIARTFWDMLAYKFRSR